MNISEDITEEFKSLGKLKVKDIMSVNIFTVNEDDELLGFIDQVKDKGYFGFPVLNKHKEIVGIVTQSDLLKLVSFQGSRAAKIVETEMFTGVPLVRSIMSTHPITLTPEDTVEDTADVMVEYGIQSIPVVEDKTVVGIVGKKDILNRIYAKVGELKNHGS